MNVKTVKWVVAGFSLAGVLCLLPADSEAVTGACYLCHTMHSSQGGTALGYTGDALGGSPPYETLLKSGCAGCHLPAATDNDAAGVGAVAGMSGAGTPFVNDNDGAQLAGGYFITAGGDTTFHNVSDSGDGSDANFVGNKIPGNANNYTASKFTCLGYDDGAFAAACHSSGGHHGNVTGDSLTGATVARSYRFLSGVDGVEDDDWQYSTTTGVADATNHNYYLAENATFAAGLGGTRTISKFCADCHGYFHSRNTDNTGIKGTTTWTRHPTDIALPATGEYASYAPATSYDVTVPVGWTTTTPGGVAGAAVICLSCHYAHGGAYNDLLRFSYGAQLAGGANNPVGCLKCHSTKDT